MIFLCNTQLVVSVIFHIFCCLNFTYFSFGMMIVVHGDEEAAQIVDHGFGNEKRSEEENVQASIPSQLIEADTTLGLNGTKRFVEGENDENLEIEERQYYGNHGYNNRPYNRPRPYRPRPYNYYNQQSRPYAYNGRPNYGRRRRK